MSSDRSGPWSVLAGIMGTSTPEPVGAGGKFSTTRSRFSLRSELGESSVRGPIVATDQCVSTPVRPADGKDKPPLLSTMMDGRFSSSWIDRSVSAPGCTGK